MRHSVCSRCVGENKTSQRNATLTGAKTSRLNKADSPIPDIAYVCMQRYLGVVVNLFAQIPATAFLTLSLGQFVSIARESRRFDILSLGFIPLSACLLRRSPS